MVVRLLNTPGVSPFTTSRLLVRLFGKPGNKRKHDLTTNNLFTTIYSEACAYLEYRKEGGDFLTKSELLS